MSINNWWNAVLALLLTISGMSCVEPYEPDILTTNYNYLVVEGYLNKSGPTSVRLSRTALLADTSRIQYVQSATVMVEGKSGDSFSLYEGLQGEYTAPLQDLNNQDEYRLHIYTPDGKEYFSDWVPIVETPEIDSVSWTYSTSNGVQLFVNTHDPQNDTRYYRWSYKETWEFNSPYIATVDFVEGELIERNPQPPIYCWQNYSSEQLILGSSAKLVRDIIYLQPLTTIPRQSWKVSSKYSILVKQYGLSKEAFEYYLQMKKNTEQEGSFFDPQPVELKGNIENANDPKETVIGFFSAGSITEKRIYIKNNQLKGWNFIMRCDLVEAPGDSLEYYKNAGLHFIYPERSGSVFGTYNVDCIDCSKRARPVKPDFWE